MNNYNTSLKGIRDELHYRNDVMTPIELFSGMLSSVNVSKLFRNVYSLGDFQLQGQTQGCI